VPIGSTDLDATTHSDVVPIGSTDLDATTHSDVVPIATLSCRHLIM